MVVEMHALSIEHLLSRIVWLMPTKRPLMCNYIRGRFAIVRYYWFCYSSWEFFNKLFLFNGSFLA